MLMREYTEKLIEYVDALREYDDQGIGHNIRNEQRIKVIQAKTELIRVARRMDILGVTKI